MGEPMQLFASSVSAAAVAMIYVIYGAYRDYLKLQLARDRTLRERVTYMLWVMANEVD
jgi:hypothetical protein